MTTTTIPPSPVRRVGPTPTHTMYHPYRHGGPYDRGAYDAFYRRPPRPHYYLSTPYQSEEITVERMTPDQRDQYARGYYDFTFHAWNDAV